MKKKYTIDVSQVEFKRASIRFYYGRIGEIITREVLQKQGFEVLAKRRMADVQDWNRNIVRTQAFFGDKLKNFKEYEKRLERDSITYTYDLLAKKDGKIYVIEVKSTKGALQYLTEEKRIGLKLAEEYGFIPSVVTMKLKIEVSNFKMEEAS